MAIYPDDDIHAEMMLCSLAQISPSDTSGAYADTFNFESKTFSHYKYPYFCGKFFLLAVEDGVYIVPDPMKTLTKWGRRDLRNDDHVKEFYISCRDGLAPLDNELVSDLLCEALAGMTEAITSTSFERWFRSLTTSPPSQNFSTK